MEEDALVREDGDIEHGREGAAGEQGKWKERGKMGIGSKVKVSGLVGELGKRSSKELNTTL
ncbi:hypothetical protein V1477_011366 [Vespula maculifrons]